jgi:hypothetical protein
MITYIAVAFNEAIWNQAFIHSILNQTSNKWKAIVFNNGPNPTLKKFIHHFTQITNGKIVYMESEINSGNWGCFNRIKALNIVDTEYVVQTSIQDYFIPSASKEILYKSGNDFIYWNSLHHYFNYDILNAIPLTGSIDWGNFAIKTSIAKEIGINHPLSYTADGDFVTDCFASSKIVSTQKINKILTIKN